MTGVWTYPWSLYSEGADEALETLADAGIDRLKIAAHYHSVRTLDPKAETVGFRTFPGGSLFDPDEELFRDTPIEPPRNDVDGTADSFGDVTAAARRHGFDVDAWVVCLHGSRLGSNWPDYRTEDAFGDGHAHAFCPSHPEVRAYLAAVVSNVARYDVDRIDLESIGFPSAFHDHGPDFGHHKDHVVTNRAEEFLVSQCFCDGCRRAADGRVDLEAAREVVADLCDRILDGSSDALPPLSDLVGEHQALADLFRFRAAVVDDLLSDLAEASGDADLSYYLADGGGYTPEELWPAGVTPEALSEHVDDVTALCYTDDVETIDRRLSACRSALDHDVDAGLTLDPDVVDDRDHWRTLSARVGDAIDGDVFVYNHGLMTNDHLEWIAESATHPSV